MIKEGLSYPLAKESDEKSDVIKMCSNENPYAPSSEVVETIKEEASNIGKYPKSGSFKLKKKISDFLGLEIENICVGNGSDEIMDLVEKATLDPGDEAVIPIPTFSQYELSCRSNAIDTNFVELEDFEWNGEKLSEELGDREIIFLGRPNNPTGNSISGDDLQKVLSTGKIVVVDEAYGEFAEETVVDWVKEYDNLVVLRTFSKIFGLAGLRVGYGVANEQMIRALERVRPPFSVNRLAQAAAISALKDKEFFEYSKQKTLEERAFLMNELEDMGFEVLPSKANFIMVSPSPLGFSEEELCKFLREERGILVRNLSGFRGISSGWVRITVGKPKQNKVLVKGLRELKEVKE